MSPITFNNINGLAAKAPRNCRRLVRTFIESYLKEMDVPSKYADLMFSVPKEQVRWIDNAEFESDLEGFIPELKDWMDARCDKRTDVEKVMSKEIDAKPRVQLTATEKKVMELLAEKDFEQLMCEDKALRELSREAKLTMFTEQK
jgi:hypothetical protein